MIRKLTHFEQPVVSEEPKPEKAQQQRVPVSPRLGIAETADAFENKNPVGTDYSNFSNSQKTGNIASPISARETVDAASMFGGSQSQQSTLDAQYQTDFARSGIVIGNEKVNFNANVNSHAHIGQNAGTETNITLGTEKKIGLEDAEFEGGRASLSGNLGPQNISLESIPGDIVDGAGDVIDWIGNLPSNLEDIFYDASWTVIDAIDDTGEAIADSPIGDAAEWLGEATEDVVDTAADGVYHAFQFIGDVAEETPIPDVLDAVGDGADAFASAMSDVGEFIGDVAEETPIPDVLDVFGDAALDVSYFLTKLVMEPADTFDEAVDATGDALQGIFDAAGEVADDAGDAIGDAFDAVGDGISDAGDAIGDAASDAGDWVGDAWDSLW